MHDDHDPDDDDPLGVNKNKELKWYEKGKFVIMPNQGWYQAWIQAKGLIYLSSLYILTYDAAFGFNQPSEIYFYVDCIQIVDIVTTFFIARRVRDLSEYV